jgi:serine phosphatase RsbU (regulator of sigma subunit)
MHALEATEEITDLLGELSAELNNFEDIVKYILPQPGDTPRLEGIDVWGGSMPLNGSVGGDHIIYVDFKQRFDLPARIKRAHDAGRLRVAENLRRCQHMAGIAIIDVAGHRVTDALLAAMLHQAFLVGVLYELDMSGRVTQRLFEQLNTRFYQSSGAHKYATLIYGEISEDARFRFLSAAHPFPVVFSRRHDRFMEVGANLRVSFPPLGTLPSLNTIDHNATAKSAFGFKDRYTMNDWWLMGAGDVMLLHTDGLTDHRRADEDYFPDRLEQTMRRIKDGNAREIFAAIQEDLIAFSDQTDDVSMVVVKLAS